MKRRLWLAGQLRAGLDYLVKARLPKMGWLLSFQLTLMLEFSLRPQLEGLQGDLRHWVRLVRTARMEQKGFDCPIYRPDQRTFGRSL